MSESQQFLRAVTLLVSNNAGQAIDLSKLRIKFSVKRSGVMTPNVADIVVYNTSNYTAQLIQNEFTRVILQAGYQQNYGVIFSGNIKQVIQGRENATDSFVEIVAGDGDQAYNFAIVNTTLAAGSTQQDQLNAATFAMENQGVGNAYLSTLPVNKLPRGKSMYGSAKTHIKRLADNNQFTWSIQDEKIVFIPQSTYLPGTAVVLTAKTGMIGTPQQTIIGVNCKCLLNPLLKIHGRAQINNAAVTAYKLNQFVPGSAENTPIPLQYDGMYYILSIDHVGDTRGTEWYSNLILISVDQPSNPLDAMGPSTYGS